MVVACIYDESGIWQYLQPALQARLPLRKILCRSRFRDGKYHRDGKSHVIDALEVTCLSNKDEYFTQLDESANSWYRGAYSHMYILRCEDLDTYKNTMRPKLRQWVDERADSGHEWMILYMPMGAKSSSRGLSGLLSKGGTTKAYRQIFEKLKSDFGPGGKELRDREREGSRLSLSQGSTLGGDDGRRQSRLNGHGHVCKLEMFDDTRNPVDMQVASGSINGASGGMVMLQQHEAQWSEVIDKLGSTIVATFDARCERYHEEIIRLESLQGGPEWNYCKFFTVKESLACMHEQLHLLNDALRLYDELGTLLSVPPPPLTSPGRVLRARRLARAEGKIVDAADAPEPPPGGATRNPVPSLNTPIQPLLEYGSELYRLQIQNGSISELSFRQYLFARQCRLLFAMNKPAQVAARALRFIPRHRTAILSAGEKQQRKFEEEQPITGPQHAIVNRRKLHLHVCKWVYCACVSVARACTDFGCAEHLRKLPPTDDARTKAAQLLSRTLAELLWCAKDHLLLLGEQLTLVPWQVDRLYYGGVLRAGERTGVAATAEERGAVGDGMGELVLAQISQWSQLDASFYNSSSGTSGGSSNNNNTKHDGTSSQEGGGNGSGSGSEYGHVLVPAFPSAISGDRLQSTPATTTLDVGGEVASNANAEAYALASQPAFAAMYLLCVQAAAVYFGIARRPRFIALLCAELASCYLSMYLPHQALPLLVQQLETCRRDSWPQLEYCALRQLADCQDRLLRADPSGNAATMEDGGGVVGVGLGTGKEATVCWTDYVASCCALLRPSLADAAIAVAGERDQARVWQQLVEQARAQAVMGGEREVSGVDASEKACAAADLVLPMASLVTLDLELSPGQLSSNGAGGVEIRDSEGGFETGSTKVETRKNEFSTVDLAHGEKLLLRQQQQQRQRVEGQRPGAEATQCRCTVRVGEYLLLRAKLRSRLPVSLTVRAIRLRLRCVGAAEGESVDADSGEASIGTTLNFDAAAVGQAGVEVQLGPGEVHDYAFTFQVLQQGLYLCEHAQVVLHDVKEGLAVALERDIPLVSLLEDGKTRGSGAEKDGASTLAWQLWGQEPENEHQLLLHVVRPEPAISVACQLLRRPFLLPPSLAKISPLGTADSNGYDELQVLVCNQAVHAEGMRVPPETLRDASLKLVLGEGMAAAQNGEASMKVQIQLLKHVRTVAEGDDDKSGDVLTDELQLVDTNTTVTKIEALTVDMPTATPEHPHRHLFFRADDQPSPTSQAQLKLYQINVALPSLPPQHQLVCTIAVTGGTVVGRVQNSGEGGGTAILSVETAGTLDSGSGASATDSGSIPPQRPLHFSRCFAVRVQCPLALAVRMRMLNLAAAAEKVFAQLDLRNILNPSPAASFTFNSIKHTQGPALSEDGAAKAAWQQRQRQMYSMAFEQQTSAVLGKHLGRNLTPLEHSLIQTNVTQMVDSYCSATSLPLSIHHTEGTEQVVLASDLICSSAVTRPDGSSTAIGCGKSLSLALIIERKDASSAVSLREELGRATVATVDVLCSVGRWEVAGVQIQAQGWPIPEVVLGEGMGPVGRWEEQMPFPVGIVAASADTKRSFPFHVQLALSASLPPTPAEAEAGISGIEYAPLYSVNLAQQIASDGDGAEVVQGTASAFRLSVCVACARAAAASVIGQHFQYELLVDPEAIESVGEDDHQSSNGVVVGSGKSPGKQHEQNWLVAGKQRGNFELDADGRFDCEVLLMPLQCGRLPLPRIRLHRMQDGVIIPVPINLVLCTFAGRRVNSVTGPAEHEIPMIAL